MNRMHCLYRFHLYDYSILGDQIDSISDLKFLAVVYNWHWNLSSHRHAAFSQFVDQTRLISTFEKSGTERGVNVHRSTNQSPSDLVYAIGMRVCCSGHEYCITQASVFPL